MEQWTEQDEKELRRLSEKKRQAEQRKELHKAFDTFFGETISQINRGIFEIAEIGWENDSQHVYSFTPPRKTFKATIVLAETRKILKLELEE